ncbi:tropinone reductase homolog At5g06060 [Rosa chinensis]|uniref:tropinone reductase homolog At5g06060 n=1 Tax=Rosa chinensis TaxID=74649 RepID=UPI000D097021|nr:tropinone reductase homolog At5g06060 [Rosa chinensis]
MAESSGNLSNLRWSLRGTTALVAGDTRGIGYAAVEELAALGVFVFACSWNSAELAERCLKEWSAKEFCVTGVNNVGTNIRKPTTGYTSEEYSKLMATNLESATSLV